MSTFLEIKDGFYSLTCNPTSLNHSKPCLDAADKIVGYASTDFF